MTEEEKQAQIIMEMLGEGGGGQPPRKAMPYDQAPEGYRASDYVAPEGFSEGYFPPMQQYSMGSPSQQAPQQAAPMPQQAPPPQQAAPPQMTPEQAQAAQIQAAQAEALRMVSSGEGLNIGHVGM